MTKTGAWRLNSNLSKEEKFWPMRQEDSAYYFSIRQTAKSPHKAGFLILVPAPRVELGTY
tara:strand:- start:9 stop:188 length:180 start_codon:yes stop_codon:yes gene_type:complete